MAGTLDGYVRHRGFEIKGAIFEGSRFRTLRASRLADETPVALKLPSRAPAGTNDLTDLRFEYSLAGRLGGGPIPRPIQLLDESAGLLLVHDLPAGLPLSNWLARPPEIRETCRIAIALAEAVGWLHERQIVHNDVRPDSILYDDRQGRVAFLDLAAAFHPSRTTEPALALNDRDLWCVAPEQTGRTSHPIDHRADLYALGIILFQALVGRPPFDAPDPLALIHAHLAGPLEPLAAALRHVPEPLGRITLRLLAKDPRERYRGAFGLAFDLRRCLEPIGVVPTFVLAKNDPPPRPVPPIGLSGRRASLATAKEVVARVAETGARELLLVSGPPGIGKTDLVHAAIAEPGVLVAEARLDTIRADGPQSALLAACRSLIQRLLMQTGDIVAEVRRRLAAEDAEVRAMLDQLLPEVRALIGAPPGVPATGPIEIQHLVQQAFRALLSAAARPGMPVVVFLDDVERADAATLTLLRWLWSSSDLRHALLLATSPTGLANLPEPVRETVEAIKAAAPVVELAVPPLSEDEMSELVGAMLGQEGDELRALASVVREKTGGNPRFAAEFVARLYAEGVLRFESATGRWTFDAALLRQMPATENLRLMFVRRLGALPETAKRVLAVAAAIGYEFSETMTAVASDASPDDALAYLLREGLIIEGSRSADDGARSFRFVHGSVQDVAYDLLDAPDREHAHRRLALHLMGSEEDAVASERLFTVVAHLAKAAGAIASAEERAQMARLNLRAGDRALESAAFEDAHHYFSRVLTDPASAGSSAVFQAHLGIGRVGYLCRRSNDSNVHLDRALQLAADPQAKAEVVAEIVLFHTQEGRSQSALDACMMGLRLIGVTLRPKPSKWLLGLKVVSVLAKLRWRGLGNLVALPRMADPAKKLAMRLLMHACLPATALARPALVASISLEMLDLSISHGNADESSFAYVTVAGFIAQLGGARRAHVLGQQSLALARQTGNSTVRLWVQMIYAGFLAPLGAHLGESVTLFRQGYDLSIGTGNLLLGSMLLASMSTFMPSTGHPIPTVTEWSRKDAQLGRQIGRAQGLLTAHYTMTWANALTGRTTSIDEPGDAEIIGAQEDERWQFELVGSLLNVQSSYLLGRYADAATSIRVTLKNPYVIRVSACYREFFAFYRALTLAAAPAPSRGARRALRKILAFFEAAEKQCPSNTSHRRALIAAELHRLEGHDRQASVLYAEAVESAKRNVFPHEEALANELAGRFHLSVGQIAEGAQELREARRGFAAWGALAKVRQLEEAYQALFESGSLPQTAMGSIDAESLTRASLALAEDIRLENLVARLMRIVIENAGAERGVLIAHHEGTLTIEAEGVVGRDGVLLSPRPLDDDAPVPRSIIECVARTGEAILADDAGSDVRFGTDRYVLGRAPKSVLVAPLNSQDRLVALMYLENNQAAGAFTKERLAIIQVLLAQAALSLENASLYASVRRSNEQLELYNRTLEERVEQRTRELHRAQQQLLMQEKLASLGTLTAGIAHEIKNPLNFVRNFADLSLELAGEMHETLKNGGQLAGPVLRDRLLEAADSLHLNSTKIVEHSKRLNAIVQGMLMHAGSSSGQTAAFDLQWTLSETVRLTCEAMRARALGFDVVVEESFAGSGQIVGAEQELRRVFSNIVDNACYAMWEKRKRLGRAFMPQLHVSLAGESRDVTISIRDNGIGIPEVVTPRLGTPFFTTKPPGEGTGLGLSISHEIVSAGHGGVLTIDSVEGEYTEVKVVLPRSTRPRAESPS